MSDRFPGELIGRLAVRSEGKALKALLDQYCEFPGGNWPRRDLLLSRRPELAYETRWGLRPSTLHPGTS
jgi:hypothetical protein